MAGLCAGCSRSLVVFRQLIGGLRLFIIGFSRSGMRRARDNLVFLLFSRAALK